MPNSNHVSGLATRITLGLMLIGSGQALADWSQAEIAEKIGDYTSAFREYKQLADEGEMQALHNLGVMYYNGFGVRQDYGSAIECFLEAAAQGVASSQNNVGYMYAHGQGVKRDYVKAHMWFNIANSNGEKTASQNLEILAAHMVSTEIEEAVRLAREWIDRSR